MTTEQLLALVVLTLAEYRVSLAIAEDVGPWRIFERFRSRFPEGWEREGVECIGCVGIYVSAFGTILVGISGNLPHNAAALVWLACAGGICFINRIAPCK